MHPKCSQGFSHSFSHIHSQGRCIEGWPVPSGGTGGIFQSRSVGGSWMHFGVLGKPDLHLKVPSAHLRNPLQRDQRTQDSPQRGRWTCITSVDQKPADGKMGLWQLLARIPRFSDTETFLWVP